MTYSLSSTLARLSCGYRLAALALLIPMLFLLAACGGDAEDPEAGAPEAEGEAAEMVAPATPVEVVQIEAGTFRDVIELTGTVEAPDDATLSAEAGGTLVALAPLGTRVGRGGAVAQVNATLNRAVVAQAEAALEAAEAQAALAEDQYRRQEPLLADSIISAAEFEGVRTQQAAARAGVAQARAALAQAREQLANTRVSAPFTGTVEQHFVERGEQVAPGTPVARLVSTSTVEIAAGVPERYANDIRQGTPVRIVPTAYGLGETAGEVTFVGSAINAQNRTFPIEVAIDNRDRTLKPAMIARLYVTRSVLEDVLAVPLTAIVRDERGASVFVAVPEADGYVAENRVVETGAASGGRVVIASGIASGDRIVVAGQTQIATGDRLRITEVATAGLAASLE
ncbi:MAG: efflux RND transporter periplasmic adaptor subunit [Bacteroidota bacterium]